MEAIEEEGNVFTEQAQEKDEEFTSFENVIKGERKDDRLQEFEESNFTRNKEESSHLESFIRVLRQ